MGDLESLPFASESFDAVVSSLTMQWIQQPQQALSEMVRVLKPDATVMIATLGPNTLHELRHCFQVITPEGPPRVNQFSAMDELRESLRQLGLDELFSHQENRVIFYQDAYDVMHHTRGIGAGNKYDIRSKQLSARNLFDRVNALYHKDFGQENGVPATWEVFYIVAQKSNNS